jgi:hypothetical protein
MGIKGYHEKWRVKVTLVREFFMTKTDGSMKNVLFYMEKEDLNVLFIPDDCLSPRKVIIKPDNSIEALHLEDGKIVTTCHKPSNFLQELVKILEFNYDAVT